MPELDANKHISEYASEDSSEVLKELNSSPEGLSDQEAKKRLKEFGHNLISKKKELNIILQFLSHFLNPLILILLIAGIASVLMGEQADAVIIGSIVLVGVVLDFYQEYSADKALKKLTESVKSKIIVMRNGSQQEINTSDLVIGDIILVNSGDTIPADARIIESKYFFVNQAAITGESFPCEKTKEKISPSSSITDLNNVVLRGTTVVSGSAKAVVIKTGKHTEFGKISLTLSQTAPKSEFEVGINHFGYFIMKVTFFLVIFIFFFNSILKPLIYPGMSHNYFLSFMFAIAIAVGVTPELLPMIMSVTMTAGSKKMAKKGVIVKTLSSIPSFGSMTVLCTDKTGTITENKIVMVKYVDYTGRDDKSVLLFAHLNSFFQTGIKNPLDEAVLNFGNVDKSKYKKIDEVPYDFYRKRMSVVVTDSKEDTLITKGAPEEIFKLCSSCRNGTKIIKFDKRARDKSFKVYHDLSGEGYRVLAIAKKITTKKPAYSKNDEAEMEFLGFVSFHDPPKRDVRSTIVELQNLGVEIKIITGDNELVTKKICSEVGLEVKGVLLGNSISELTAHNLRIKAQNTTIFARCSPAEKEKIISVLRSANQVVGYLGDGINDAPPLKAADVGISVNTAVDVAKESAEIVLTKKSLHDLKNGIIEGRKTFGNTMKYVMMALSSNFGNMFSATGAVIFLPFLPMLPIQILLNNLIYDFSQITIPADKVDDDWIQKPRRWNINFIKKFMYTFGPISTIFDFITFFVLFFILKASEPVFQTGWFMESLATQTLVIHIIRTKNTPFLKSNASKLLIFSSLFCFAFGWILPYTPWGALFKFTPLPGYMLAAIIAIIITYLLVVEVVKRRFYKKQDFSNFS